MKISVTKRCCTTCHFWGNPLRTYYDDTYEMEPPADYLKAVCMCSSSQSYSQDVNYDYSCRKWKPSERQPLVCSFHVNRYDDDYIYYLEEQKLVFKKGSLYHRDLKEYFRCYALANKNKYVEFFDWAVKEFEDIYDSAIEEMLTLMKDSVDLGVLVLKQYGIEDVAAEDIVKTGGASLNPSPIISRFVDLADMIIATANELSATRATKQMRRRSLSFQGGGFGLAGAITGAVTAGALNLGVDAIRGIGDYIGNSRDRAKIKHMQENVVTNPETKSSLANAVYEFAINVGNVVEEILAERKKIPPKYRAVVGSQELDEYMTLFRRANHDLAVPPVEMATLYNQIEKNPFEEKWYYLLYISDSAGRKQVLDLAAVWGVTDTCKCIMDDYDKRCFEKAKLLPEKSSAEIQEKLAALSIIESRHQGYVIQEISLLQEKYDKLYEAECTFRGVKYKDLETRKLAENEYTEQEVAKKMRLLNTTDVAQMRDCVAAFEKMKYYNAEAEMAALQKAIFEEEKRRQNIAARKAVNACASPNDFLLLCDKWGQIGVVDNESLTRLKTYASDEFMKKFSDTISKASRYKTSTDSIAMSICIQTVICALCIWGTYKVLPHIMEPSLILLRILFYFLGFVCAIGIIQPWLSLAWFKIRIKKYREAAMIVDTLAKQGYKLYKPKA